MNVSQQSALCSPEEVGRVTVIGCGSVGSHVATSLARIGVRDITLYDADHVESHNVPMSAFGVQDVGFPKVDVVARRILEDTGICVNAVPRMYAGEPLQGSIIACVDTMEARATIWRAVRHNPLIPAFIDTRIAANLVHVYRLIPTTPQDIDLYEMRLYPSVDATPPTCGRHGIIYITSHAASVAVGSLVAIRQGRKPSSLYEFSFSHVEQL